MLSSTPGCSSGSGTTTADGDDTKFCQDLDARSVKCRPDSVPKLEKCKTEWANERKFLRPELVAPLQQCLVQRGCDVADDRCFASVGEAAPASSVRDSYQAACLAKVKECTKSVITDDLCTDGDIPWRLFTDDVYLRATACFSKPCSEVSSCMDAMGEAIKGQR